MYVGAAAFALSPLNVIYGHKDDSNEKICNLFPLLWAGEFVMTCIGKKVSQ